MASTEIVAANTSKSHQLFEWEAKNFDTWCALVVKNVRNDPLIEVGRWGASEGVLALSSSFLNRDKISSLLGIAISFCKFGIAATEVVFISTSIFIFTGAGSRTERKQSSGNNYREDGYDIKVGLNDSYLRFRKTNPI